MKIKKSLRKVIFEVIVLLIVVGVIALIANFPTHQAHSTIMEYLKIILSWPGVILILSFILLYIMRLIYFPKTKIEFVEIGKPDVTGFIKIIGKTEEGNLIIKNENNYKINDGDAIVNKSFIIMFHENQTKIRKLKKELKRYQEKLLEK
jgi:hypothetical protein